ncbi:MAG: glycosyltransferase family 4 protein [Dehalococcoidia bacterium]|nr:glycosyltransferase family 4 protein [Dehalococcoidia bacterium]
MGIHPDNTIFVVLSFEGPDVYSMAGGLGSRISHLTNNLAEMGFQVHHIFIGDPEMEGMEACKEGKLVLHRWCQWISQYHPGGVYDGEEGKLYDFNQSVPTFVAHELATSAISQGKLVAILGEEWHTAEAMCCISDLLYYSGLHDKTLMFWNANNTYGFERINWQRLGYATTITTVSKYMKQIMLKMGINPLVIPNGIPKAILSKVDERNVSRLKGMVQADLTLSKVARWHPDKGWKPAIRAIDILKKSGLKPVLFARGGSGSYGMKISHRPRLAGIMVKDILLDGDLEECYRQALFKEDFTPYFEAISKGGQGDIINLLFPIPSSFLQVIYKASDVVLANSIREPFGLVGLEAMATGAVVFTGCSGEDYATHMYNAIVLDTFSAEEITFYIDYLHMHPERRKAISSAARRTAEQWTWEEVAKRLICKLEYQAQVQGVSLPSGATVLESAERA